MTQVTEYRGLRLRAHELLRDIPLYDVSVVDLPGGGPGRSIADIGVLDSSTAPSRVAVVLSSSLWRAFRFAADVRR